MNKLVTGVMAAEVVNEITMGRGTTKTMSTWQTVKTKPMWSQQQTRTNNKTHTQQPADQTEVMTVLTFYIQKIFFHYKGPIKDLLCNRMDL